MGSMAAPDPDMTAYRVTIGERVETFDRLDTALAYLRSKIVHAGAQQVTLEAARMNPLRYAAEVEEQEAACLASV